jgi:acetylornithine deacetylase/succinyl-diaminopimelate desuccinylase-like protein
MEIAQTAASRTTMAELLERMVSFDTTTIIRGPGDIAQAHQPDEWIAESGLEACDRFIRRLADRLLV